MSSNGLWKVTSQPPSILGHMALSLSSGNSSHYTPKESQDEPIDFSQKSESTTTTQNVTSFPNDGGSRKKIKTENGVVPQNGYARSSYPLDNRGYAAALDQYYCARDKEPFARQQNGMLNGIEKNSHEGIELVHPQTRDSSPKIENRNPFTYLGAPPSPTSCSQSDVTSTRVSPRTPESDAHMENLSSSSLETDSNMANGKDQFASQEAKVNNMDVGNGEGIGSLHLNENLPIIMVPSTSSGVAHLKGDSEQFSSARILNSKGLPQLPKLTIPIMKPMNVRKSNASSPRTSTPLPDAAPFPVEHSPPITSYEGPVRTFQLPNPWPIGPPYMQTSILQAQLQDKKPTKQVRPFKAYSNDIIKSCHPGMMAVPLGRSSNNFEHFFKLHPDYFNQIPKNALLGEIDTKKENNSELPTTSDKSYDCQSTTATIGLPDSLSSPEIIKKGIYYSNDSSLSPRNDESQPQSPDNGSSRKKGNRLSENEKDPAYWERRRKNNEAAKRSRDARRRKEDALAMTAKELLEDKMRMTMHLTFQMKEMQKLEEENRFLKDRELTLKNYVYHLENRCRDCSTCNNHNPEKRPL